MKIELILVTCDKASIDLNEKLFRYVTGPSLPNEGRRSERGA